MTDKYTAVDTRFGKVQVKPTDKNHIYVVFADNAHYQPISPLTVRGIQRTGSAHFYLWSDGTWHIGIEKDSPFERRSSLWLNTVWDGKNFKPVPSKTYDAIHQELTTVIPAWTATEEGKAELWAAYKVALAERIEDATKKLAEKKAEVEKAEEELAAMKGEYEGQFLN